MAESTASALTVTQDVTDKSISIARGSSILTPATPLGSDENVPIDEFQIPSLSSWSGRPILYSIRPCWYQHLDNKDEEAVALTVGILFILLTAILAEGLHSFREALEAEQVIVVCHNTVDVNAQGTVPVVCESDDKECIRVVEEVVSPVVHSRTSWLHVRNSFLYGAQCSLQMLVLFGVLSLNIGLIAAAVAGVFLGRLMFHWRPRLEKLYGKAI